MLHMPPLCHPMSAWSVKKSHLFFTSISNVPPPWNFQTGLNLSLSLVCASLIWMNLSKHHALDYDGKSYPYLYSSRPVWRFAHLCAPPSPQLFPEGLPRRSSTNSWRAGVCGLAHFWFVLVSLLWAACFPLWNGNVAWTHTHAAREGFSLQLDGIEKC